MKIRKLNESKPLHEGRPLTVDVEGLKKSIRPLCSRVIQELGLPIDSFTLSSGSLKKNTRPVYYTFTFNIHLRGDIIAKYSWEQDEDRTVNLKISLSSIPTDVKITPELLYNNHGDHVKETIRSYVFTSSEQDNYSAIYNDKLAKVTDICSEIGSKYSIELEPSFYPSLKDLSGTPDETITLYIKPTAIEGKLGDLQPSRFRSGYMEYTVDNISYSSSIGFVDHRFSVPAANFKPVDYEFDYNQIRNEIESHIQTLLQRIDEVDQKIRLHPNAEKKIQLQLQTINAQMGNDVLTRGANRNLGFSIACNINGKTFDDYVTEEEALDANFWRKYKRKVQQRMRSANTPTDNSRVNHSTRIDFDEE